MRIKIILLTEREGIHIFILKIGIIIEYESIKEKFDSHSLIIITQKVYLYSVGTNITKEKIIT